MMDFVIEWDRATKLCSRNQSVNVLPPHQFV